MKYKCERTSEMLKMPILLEPDWERAHKEAFMKGHKHILEEIENSQKPVLIIDFKESSEES